MKIRALNIGQEGKVIGYTGMDKAYRHKLLRMGLNKGTTFRVVRKAPMGDPIEIQTRGFNLTLRKTEADILDVDVVEA